MSGLAVFGLKFPSLLDYDRKRSKDATAENLRNLYIIKNPPSEMTMGAQKTTVKEMHASVFLKNSQ